jgi:Mn-dependent DtxR family transcriptional regulator
LKSYEETLEDLKRELLRIGSTKQRDYDLLKKKGQVFSTAICRRLKLSWPEAVEQTGVKLNKRV